MRAISIVYIAADYDRFMYEDDSDEEHPMMTLGIAVDESPAYTDSFQPEIPKPNDTPKLRKSFPETWLWNNILPSSERLVSTTLRYLCLIQIIIIITNNYFVIIYTSHRMPKNYSIIIFTPSSLTHFVPHDDELTYLFINFLKIYRFPTLWLKVSSLAFCYVL